MPNWKRASSASSWRTGLGNSRSASRSSTRPKLQGSDLRQTSLVTAQAAAAEARKNLDQLQRDRELFSIASGIDGVVVYGSFRQKAWKTIEPDQLAPGEKVQADQVLLTVYQPGKLGLTAECPENQLGYFSAGTKVRVTPQAVPDLEYEGICQTPSVIAENQGQDQIFNIKVVLPGVDQAAGARVLGGCELQWRGSPGCVDCSGLGRLEGQGLGQQGRHYW